MARFLCLLSAPYQGEGVGKEVKEGPDFRNDKNKCFINKRTNRVCNIVNDGLLGPPCLAVETVENECIVSMTRRHCL